MSIGPAVRRALGPIEAPVAKAYRGIFVDIDALGDAIASFDLGRRVLEVGTGGGTVAAQIVARRPDVHLLGIDLIDDPGQHFDGDRSRVEFRTQTIGAPLAEDPEPFDAVVIADVLHHVPPAERAELLSAVDDLLSPHGVLLIKESVVVASPGYWLGHFSDRWITGDRNVSFLTESAIEELVAASVRDVEPIGRTTIRPWSTNLLRVWRRRTEPIEE